MKNLGNNFRVINLLFLFFLCPLLLRGEEYYVHDQDYFLDPPEGWEILDASDLSAPAFTDPERSTIFQIMSFPGDSYSSSDAIYKVIKARLQAKGEGAPFSFSGRDSIFSDLSFSAGKYRVRGYLIFINGTEKDYVLLSYTPIERYGKMHDFLLSSLDSFSLDDKEKYLPGPVSQFYYPFPGRNPEPVELTINEKYFRVHVDRQEFEAAQVVIEREARILTSYTKDRIKAWQRYYRMIYRDNYHRLDNMFRIIIPAPGTEKLFPQVQDVVVNLLSWIQSFSYYRTGTTADLLSPISTAFYATGDCDSRALLYIILLHHLEVDSILLVSSRYSHSLVGVNIAGKGARINFESESYLIAEVTEPVSIGLIPQDMADASGWIPVRLGDF